MPTVKKKTAKKQAPDVKAARKKSVPKTSRRRIKPEAMEVFEVQSKPKINRSKAETINAIAPPKALDPSSPGNRLREVLPTNQDARMIAMNLMLQSGRKSPIEVMFENMWWAHEEAEALLSEFVGKLQTMDGAEEVQETFSLLRETVRMRGISQACARDAAPYVHAKLSLIDIGDLSKNGEDEEITVVKRVIYDPKSKAA